MNWHATFICLWVVTVVALTFTGTMALVEGDPRMTKLSIFLVVAVALLSGLVFV